MNISDRHSLISNSLFSLYRQPEQVRDLEITASLMRSLQGISEAAGLSSAGEFSSRIYDADDDERLEDLDDCPLNWLGQTLIAGGLDVPPSEKEKSGSPGSVMTLVPLTPEVAKHTCFTRKTGNPWNPGAYIQGMILRGSRDSEQADRCWEELAKAFSVTSSDGSYNADAWATIVDFAARQISGEESWDGTPANGLRPSAGWAGYPGNWTDLLRAYPPKSFVEDIGVLAKLEGAVTRRTWVSLMDCFLRLAVSADLLFIGRINRGLENVIRESSSQFEFATLSDDDLAAELLRDFDAIEIGAHCESILKREVRDFAKSHLFVNAYLSLLSGEETTSISDSGGLSTPDGINRLAGIAQELGVASVQSADSIRSQLVDNYPNMMSLKGRKTWTHQLYFALRYGLGQRSASEANRHFDQGYWCRKSGPSRSHPWHFEMSPVGVITMVHLVTAAERTATARDLQSKLGEYGISVSLADLSRGSIGMSLRRLGLVTDSPDAEGGMVLRNPFAQRIK